jgi:hypothetical protein
MPPTQHEQGECADGPLLHVVRRGLSGAQALCKAGPIAQVVAGRFDTDAADACPACCTALEANRA